jgi:hypothetical protein
MRISNNILSIPVLILILISTLNTFHIMQKKGLITGLGTQAQAQISFVVLQIPSAISSPENISVKLGYDNVSIDLSWANVSGVDSYIIYYSDNISLLKQLNTSNLASGIYNVTGITDNNWTDSTAGSSNMRYYTVASVKGDNINFSTKFFGKFDIEVKAATMIPGEIEVNTISLPLIPINCSISDIIKTTSYFDMISYYNTTRSPSPAYDTSYFDGTQWVGPIDCLEPGKGYIFGLIAIGYNWTYNRS